MATKTLTATRTRPNDTVQWFIPWAEANDTNIFNNITELHALIESTTGVISFSSAASETNPNNYVITLEYDDAVVSDPVKVLIAGDNTHFDEYRNMMLSYYDVHGVTTDIQIT